jgi:hypothetical protein
MAAEGCEGWDPSLSWRRGLLTTGVSSELTTGVSSELTAVSSELTGVSSELTGVSSELTGVSSELTGVSILPMLRFMTPLFAQIYHVIQ